MKNKAQKAALKERPIKILKKLSPSNSKRNPLDFSKQQREINITCTMLTTKNEQSVLKSMQVYWIYCSVCASLLDILLILALFPVKLHTPSCISSKVA